MRPRSLALRAPRSQDEWDRLHAIRKQHIFDVYHPPDGPWPCEYDPAHPDDRDPANRPLLLVADGEVAGTLRLDLKPDGRAVVRLVALEPAFRGDGLGGAILGMAEDLARKAGAHSLCVNAQPGVVGFYARRGFAPGRWKGCSSCPRGVPMAKALASPPPEAGSALVGARGAVRGGMPAAPVLAAAAAPGLGA